MRRRSPLVVLFDVAGKPKPQPRARSKQHGPGVYTPPDADEWKHEIRAQAKLALLLDHAGEELPLPAPTPFGLAVSFRMPRPQSHWRTGRHAGTLKDWAPYHHTAKPDLDNMIKALKDALGSFQGLPPLIWCDDAQVVCYIDPRKRYVHKGEEPGVSVAIIELREKRHDDPT